MTTDSVRSTPGRGDAAGLQIRSFADLMEGLQFTPAEMAALLLTRELASVLRQICGDGADWEELVDHLHVIQRAVGSQIAARIFPDVLRPLGEE